MKKSKQKSNSGFTLIELLLVISIITLLTSILLVDVKNARFKARDIKRKGDLHQISVALEEYYSDHGGYPGIGSLSATDSVTIGNYARSTNPVIWTRLGTPLITGGYLSFLPNDPINIPTAWIFPWVVLMSYDYQYRSNGTKYNPDATHYILCTWLEDHSDHLTLQFNDVEDPYAPGTSLYTNDGYSPYAYCIAK